MDPGVEAFEPAGGEPAAQASTARTGAGGRLVLIAIFSTVLSVVPVFLVGALAVFVRSDLHFSETRLAIAVSVFYSVAAVASPFAGRLGQRIGGRRGMILAAGLSGVSLIGMAALADSWAVLTAMLAVAGLGNALAQPSANLVVAEGISVDRQGVAFGLKQSAVPAASVMAGLSVPLLGSTVGWRWAIALASLGAVGIVVVMAAWDRKPTAVRRAPAPRPRATPDARNVDGPLVMLACAAALAVAASSSLGPFYVESGVAHGLSVDAAGLLLALGGGAAMVARVVYGWLADRRGGRHLQFVAVLMLLGAGGLLVYSLAHQSSTTLLVVGTLLMFTAGWGWNGLFTFAVVRRYASAPATATGITLAGMRTGGIVGPLGFGLLLQHTSYAVAWFVAAMMMLSSALLVFLVRRVMRRSALLIPTSKEQRP